MGNIGKLFFSSSAIASPFVSDVLVACAWYHVGIDGFEKSLTGKYAQAFQLAKSPGRRVGNVRLVIESANASQLSPKVCEI
jgi:hypothetical protein